MLYLILEMDWSCYLNSNIVALVHLKNPGSIPTLKTVFWNFGKVYSYMDHPKRYIQECLHMIWSGLFIYVGGYSWE